MERARNFIPKDAWSHPSSLLGKKKAKRLITILRNASGDSLTTDDEKANALAETFDLVTNCRRMPISGNADHKHFWSNTDLRIDSDPFLQTSDTISDSYVISVSKSQLRKIIKNLKHKAPGIDDINNCFIKQGGNELLCISLV